MGRPNVNWNIGIALDKHSTYTSKTLKAGIPFAQQVTEPSIKYIIKYDFDLGGGSVDIPENCILEFDGGSLTNGTLVGDNTIIQAKPTHIFSNITIEGVWKTDCAYPEWFGAKGDGETDDTSSFQNALNAKFGYYIATGIYNINDTLIVHTKNVLDGNNIGKIVFYTENEDEPCIVLGTGEKENNDGYTFIQNINIESNEENKGYGIYCYRRTRVLNCKIRYFNYGIAVTSYSVEVSSCSISHNFVNVGIASAQLTIGSPIQQTNHVVIKHGNITSSTSGDNIVIGKATGRNPWAVASSDYSYGHLIELHNVALDAGDIFIENITGVTIKQCYLEHNDNNIVDTRIGTGIYLGKNVRNVVIKNNWFHMLDYGIKSLETSSFPNGISIDDNTCGTIGKTMVYFLKCPTIFSFRNNWGSANDYLQAHFGMYQMSASEVNQRLQNIKNNTSLFDRRSDFILYNEDYSIEEETAYDFGVCSENYLTFNTAKSVNGTFTEDTSGLYFTLSAGASLKSIYPGSKIKNKDCYISHVDIENRKFWLYSPTDDYPEATGSKIDYQVAQGFTICKRVSKTLQQLEAADLRKGEIVYDSYLSKMYAKIASVWLSEILSVNTSLARQVQKAEDLSASVKVLIVNVGVNITDTINVTPGTIIYYMGGSLFGNGTINFTNNIIVGVNDIGTMINSSVTVTGTYYIGTKPSSGNTVNRPTNVSVGLQYFDTTLGKPIYYNGTNWVDATGTIV